MHRLTFFIIFYINLSTGMLFSLYEIGDTMSVADQYIEYDICYGEYIDNVFKFADVNGSENGGYYKISIIGISATW